MTAHSRLRLALLIGGLLIGDLAALSGKPLRATDFSTLQKQYAERIQPLLQANCWQCHSTEKQKGELDLERFASLKQIRDDSSVWQKVVEMLDSREMPPRDAPQLTDAQRSELRSWLDEYMAAEGAAMAGDPGSVVLRRLNNAEYTLTIRELTGQALEPAREFPADSAAGEGFTNTGNSLVMSPALLDKHMTAAKSVAEHAILLPDGIRFSPHTTRRDWTDDVLQRLRTFYAAYTDPSGSTRVNLQGLQWDTNAGGRLPLAPYLRALIEARAELHSGATTIDALAATRELNAKYLGTLWEAMHVKDSSALIKRIQEHFENTKPEAVPQLVAEIEAWQKALTRFQSVGHMKPWLAPMEPFVDRQELRVKLEPPAGQEHVVIRLAAGDAEDGNNDDRVIWSKPRLIAPGRADIFVSEVAALAAALNSHRQALFTSSARSLSAAAEFMADEQHSDVDALAVRYSIDPLVLHAWFDYLSITAAGSVRLDQLFTDQLRAAGGYDFVNGWGSPQTPSIYASAGDKHVRIPGNMKPHGVVVHPSPNLNAAVSWRSPLAGTVRVEGAVTHAHPECGNGVSWAVELRRGAARQRLAAGVAHGGTPVAFGPINGVRVRPGEIISLLVGPRDSNHSCDLTDVEFTLTEQNGAGTEREVRVWNLSADVSPDILSGNPHADAYGHTDTWSFYAEPIAAGDQSRALLPNGSELQQWLVADDAPTRANSADQVQALLTGNRPVDDTPNRALWDQAHDPNGPLVGALVDQLVSQARNGKLAGDPNAVLSGNSRFGQSLKGGTQPDNSSLAVRAPAVLTLQLPSELCRGRELVVAGELDSLASQNGCVQLQVSASPDPAAVPPPLRLTPTLPLLAADGGRARGDFAKAAQDFRQLFPAALCYTKIVPVDEVVTLALFHREDENLRRLMLGPQETAQLDGLWEELHFVSHDLLTVEDAYEQIMQFLTQDGDPKLFEHLRQPIQQRSAEFRAAQIAAQPRHLQSVIEFASQAFRRPLTAEESGALKSLYDRLRAEGIAHEAATRLLLVRVLVSTSFLYRLEQSHPGTASSPVSDWELASRLSYFLWSGPPDEPLRAAAASGKLRDLVTTVAQSRRMLSDPRVSNLARQFACQWLQIQDIGELDEKSERHFPEFAQLRGALQTEAETFFTDLFQNDRSVLDVFDGDSTFLNEQLAKHYGVEGVKGDAWRRVTGMRQVGRGGVLTLGATLAKQSGASRTSPILRGNWISEVLLGERLPRPPKDVPPLPSDESSESMTVRQLVERHTSDQRCASCHERIDPFGFALESYDAIGRLRTKDAAGHALDTAVTLPDGSRVVGADELRRYLVEQKRDVLLKQFCRKLLGYALGRAVQLSDQQLLSEMQRSLAENDYRFSAAIEPIVRSRQFTHIRDQNVE